MDYNSEDRRMQSFGWNEQHAAQGYEDVEFIPGMELNQENIDMFNNANRNMYDSKPKYMTPFNQYKMDQDNIFGINSQNQVFMSDSTSESSPSVNSNINNTSQQKQVSHNSPDSLSSATVVESERIGKARPKTKKQLLDEQDAILIARDDSELTENELQLKRKAQNRAAQRAFRERKETKLKELESKLLRSEEERQKLVEQLELIKQQNMAIVTENEILRSRKESDDCESSNRLVKLVGNKFTFPKDQNQFIEGLIGDSHQINNATVNKVYDSPDHPGKKILAVGAVWDYLQIKALERDIDSSTIDVIEIMSKLRGHERCHGFGPAYPLELVDEVINTTF